MISAMPAVAVRRERKKTRSLRSTNGPSSRRSSVASLSRGGRAGTASVSTIYSQAGGPFYQPDEKICGLTREQLRVFIYLGTVLLVTGLVLVFIGVGAEVTSTNSVGLVFIGIGALLCLIKLFFSESRNMRPKKTPLPKASPVEEGYIVVPVNMPSFQKEIKPKVDTPNGTNQTITPSSLNSIPETQVLISEEKIASEKF